jgi:hypothetical protein
VTPVMTRCAHGYPVAECLEHNPPKPPDPAPLDDDPDCIAQPSAIVYVLGGWAVIGLAAWGILGLAAWGAWKLGTWVAGQL